ncbi:DUF421 domain-containing protein [Thermoactinomyces intermedius]|jgi:uncharacterized membrane protein YcaP (DUF421 family)|uniref:DUF421 domain-containing protein n=2 Tax=Thermoactinomyces TaxID=2023 RepID=A0A8I1DF59_THEIN|nr:DUF421 domain-containing protein [Thermoactinomyces intermedius]MBA4836692.1 DUF421 domain-containing protein [Thermoactinomyces intermedius]MBH8594496.1 DUF421 domain-containing protein [Thermoactinomyces intermedius]MBH8601600.1 DUF421 domain-containing protein [Thermoactinomyces sp. CICC 23799]
MRMMGKREIGKLSVFDLIVSFMIADLSAMAIDSEKPMFIGIISILTLAIFQVFISYLSLKSKKIREWADGKPVVIVEKGKILDDQMAKARYNMDDLMVQLREKNIADVSDVEFAILETTGKLSVFPKEKKTCEEGVHNSLRPFQMPVPLIIDGKVQDEGLRQIGKTRFWLKNEIQKQGYRDFKEIFYASVNSNGKLFIDRKDS